MDVDGVAWDPHGPSQQISWDEEGDVPGFGVRVYPSGAKSFVVWVRNRDTGRKRLLTLGRVGEVTLPEARDEAARKVEAYRAGRAGSRAGGGRPDAPGQDTESESALTPTQVLELLAAIDQEANPFRRAALRLYVQTDLPRKDLLRIEWADVDLVRGMLRHGDPGGEEQWVPLSPDAVSLLAALPRREDSPYVFCGRTAGSHISGVSRSWRAARDRAGFGELRLDDLRHALERRQSEVPGERRASVEGAVHGEIALPGQAATLGAVTTREEPSTTGEPATLIRSAAPHGLGAAGETATPGAPPAQGQGGSPAEAGPPLERGTPRPTAAPRATQATGESVPPAPLLAPEGTQAPARPPDATGVPAPGAADGDPLTGPTATPPPAQGGRRRRPRLPATTLGVEIAPGRLRAYRPRRRRRPPEAMEVEWGSPAPRASLDALVERFGTENALSVALDMAFVHVKRLELPPLPMEERRRMISLDSRRYFPILDEDLVAGVREDDLVIAASAPKLDGWIEALGGLGTVERVESAPTALARHLAAGGFGDGVLVLSEPSERDVTLARVETGSLAALRKVPAGAVEVSDIVSEMADGPSQIVLHPFRDDLARALGAPRRRFPVASMPAPPGSPAAFAAARGAAVGVTEGPELTLSSPLLQRRLGTARRRRALLHVAALVATLALLGGAIDHRRSATLAGLEEAIAATQDQAAQVLELSQEAAAIGDELSLLAGEMRTRANPMDVLLEVTRLLPTTAYLTQLTFSGDQWELSGLAEDAASLIPLLEASPRLDGVRFRGATTRARAQGRDLESFTVVFRHVPAT